MPTQTDDYEFILYDIRAHFFRVPNSIFTLKNILMFIFCSDYCELLWTVSSLW